MTTTATSPRPQTAPRIAASQLITPCLWFDDRIEEAANLYVSVFENSRVLKVARYGDAGPLPAGKVMTIEFELAGHKFRALNGGPRFPFSPAVSFAVRCETQAEVDYFSAALTAGGGKQGHCGWIEDRFGLSWQIVPEALVRYASDKDPAKAGRVMAAMMQMMKIDIAALDKAYAG
jgi:predicted 3-demethylubiquinone-9 3-methyltransferase (glyoxalase superfamily)